MKAISALSMAFLIAITLLSSACQRSSESHQNSDPAQPLFMGKLDKKMSEIYDDKNKDFMNVCDYQWRPKILEISRVLEKNREAIDALTEGDAQAKPQKILDFGSYKFSDDSETPAGKDDWVTRTYSWSRIAKTYELIKNDPKDPRWVSLNRLARGIVSDDERRIVNGSFTNATRAAGPMILAIHEKAEACKKIETCVNPGLSKEEENFLAINAYFLNEIRLFYKATAPVDEKRTNLLRFALRIHYLAERYDFHKEDLLKVDGKALIVPMNLTALGDDGAALFIQFVQKVWNTNSEYSVKVESIKDGSPAYTVQISDEMGGRAHVLRREHTMQLYDWSNVKTFTHEFGHILGFEDTYFTSWNTDTCSYSTESNHGDIMSNGAEGQVLSTHWDKLKAIYWQ